jgi:hypothetical protein
MIGRSSLKRGWVLLQKKRHCDQLATIHKRSYTRKTHRDMETRKLWESWNNPFDGPKYGQVSNLRLGS